MPAVHFIVRDGHGQALPGPAPEPTVSISADAETLVALANGTITIPKAISRGAKIQGAPDAIQRMLEILPPPTSGVIPPSPHNRETQIGPK